jgi:hypothetical protein
MELHEALRQISDIRQQMAKSQVFRGYRSATVGFSGLLGILAAAAQMRWVEQPEIQLGSYVTLWFCVAVASLVVACSEMAWRASTAGSQMAREMTLLAITQFLPSLVVGALLTLCIVQKAPQVAWMLPGLWSLVFALGVFASYRLLPKQAFWVAVYYTVCGCLCLIFGEGENALSPWFMGCTFGLGQFLAAGILYYTLERSDVS